MLLLWSLDHILLNCPTLPPNASREKKDKQEYGVWLVMDTKFHKESKLLMGVNIVITHINHIRAGHLEHPVSGQNWHGNFGTVDR